MALRGVWRMNKWSPNLLQRNTVPSLALSHRRYASFTE